MTSERVLRAAIRDPQHGSGANHCRKQEEPERKRVAVRGRMTTESLRAGQDRCRHRSRRTRRPLSASARSFPSQRRFARVNVLDDEVDQRLRTPGRSPTEQRRRAVDLPGLVALPRAGTQSEQRAEPSPRAAVDASRSAPRADRSARGDQRRDRRRHEEQAGCVTDAPKPYPSRARRLGELGYQDERRVRADPIRNATRLVVHTPRIRIICMSTSGDSLALLVAHPEREQDHPGGKDRERLRRQPVPVGGLSDRQASRW